MIEIPNEIVDYFSTSNISTLFLIPETLRQNSKVGEILRGMSERLKQIDTLGRKYQPSWYKELVNLHGDIDVDWVIGHFIDKAIAMKRLSLLNTDRQSPQIKPYEHPDLQGIEVDSNNLVKLSEFDISLGYLRRGSSVFEILPSIGNSTNSMYWALRILFRLAKQGEIRIRLDPLMVQQSSTYSHLEYRMWVYGKELDWQDIRSLKDDRHMKWQPDHGWQPDVEFTDLVWSPRDNEIHFACEELPKIEESSVRGSRYFHGIYVPDKHRFIHCDGAIRLYSHHELEQRYSTHVRNSGKTGKRVKIFQADIEITTVDWASLVSAFFVWNRDVEKYFEETES